MEQLLITAADILEIRPISDKIEDARLGPYILEAQECDIRPILNDAFYNYVTKTRDEQVVQDLIYGKEYTYQDIEYAFSGLAPVLAYYTLSRFIPGNALNVTSFGVVVKSVPQSTPADSVAIQNEVKAMKNAAVRYQEELIKFLDRNKDTYPLWKNEGRSENKGRTTGLNFFRG